jgi:hypothetical protein
VRRTELLARLAEGGPVAREVLREMFPNAIQLQPDSREERLQLQLQQAAVFAAFAAQSRVVGNNGSGGLL